MNRAVVAARATPSTPLADPRVSRNPLARTATISAAPGYTGTRRHGNRRPGADKGQGLWRTVSPSYPEGRDPRWSTTAYTNPA